MGVKSRGVRPARFLRCFDKNGENVYLPFELKGKFSAIAKEDNISGVHTPENLTSKRLPVMARLVHGLPPVGLKSSQSFLPELRLFNVIEEDYLVAMTLGEMYFSISRKKNGTFSPHENCIHNRISISRKKIIFFS